MTSYEVFTDGACKGNPGKGGWGVYIRFPDGNESEHFGGDEFTTNNQMELRAAIEGIRLCGQNPCILYTDSEYVMKGITEWMPNWKSRGWRTAANKPVKNKELWQELDALVQITPVVWKWVRGHAGHPGNERADMLANRGCV